MLQKNERCDMRKSDYTTYAVQNDSNKSLTSYPLYLPYCMECLTG